MNKDTFKNAKILVVGGAGFVGSNLVIKLLEHDPAEIIVVDNLLSSEASNVPVSFKRSFCLRFDNRRCHSSFSSR